ncbi:PREDICTED: deleted in malignant brain tumors 1 protein-like [Amphimedon queenslandica]|uniref:Deleted in malignant brain tumors 1 protein n=1 Tax=Amphimedon queenslandica TaxID=400682 RepID=A0AAN0JTK3_AMPQE|nr:PREDICTED: deleted in malignant brain tumors 1 protein-like [Amphimedon queenslandica]|eukprot:XP_019860164.1 PREDICTED: deleted in malignant brain tumors 1 protein-like [Amphimedon queenslandica]
MATFHHQYDAGVRCQPFCKTGDVRIVGTTDPLVGRVEVCVDETWGTVCDDYWHNDDARVVCRQLGFSGNEAMALTGLYTDYQKLFHIIDLNCNGTENSVFNCSHNTIEEYSCLDYEDTYVQCSVFNASDNCSNGDIRLTGGPSQYEGIVEVCYERVWGSICPPAWSRADAQVTCRQLGYTTIGAATSNIYGKSAGPIHFSNFYCSSSENFLLNCSHGTSSCYNYDNHAGVKCEAPCVDGDIRLKGNVKFHNFGRVEICVNGTWGTVCDNEWDNTDARVVCEQLGYSPYGALARHSYFFERQLPHKLFNVNCTGDEDALLDCSYQTSGSTCSQSDDSGVICQVRDVTPSNCTDYDVRLVDGEFHNEGKVEICLNDIWGTFCNSLDANMICQEVGYSNGGEVYNAQSPSAGIDDVILVGGMSCAQSATSIDQCSFSLYNSAFTCDVRDIIAIRCHNCSNGSIRLIDYNARAEKLGRVEVCVNGEWGGICSQFFTDIDAKVVCRHLGYSELGSVSLGNLYSDFDVPLHVMNLNCTGSEEVIWDCPSSVQGQELCSIWKDVSVYCYDYDAEYSDCFNGQLRLSNGSATLQGRLEMCYSNAWFGLYAGDFHNYFKGATACNGLGYSNGMNIGYSSSFLDLPYIPLFPLQYSCSSVRNSFLDCSSSPLLYYNSYTYLFFGVTCPEKCTTGDVQLSGSDYDNMGRVEVCINGTWGTICSSSFDFNDAIVVCSHLGYLSYGVMIISSTNRYVSFYYPVFIYDLNCTGSENNLWDCPYNDTVRYCSTYSDAAIICQRDNSTVNKSCVTGEIQLVGGTNEYEGRVEICYNQMWGTVCDNSWDTVDSNVVCSQLGHQPFGSNPLYGSYFGDGHSPFMLSNVACSSNIEQANARLIDCGYSAPKAVLSCGDGESASVVCLEACTNGDVKLSGSSFENSGLLEVCIERLWTTVCDKTWDFNDAAVACKQLGFSSYGAMPLYNCYTEGQLSFGITNISCNGSEEQIFGCSYSNSITNCMQHNDAGIMCQDAGVKSNCTSGDIRLTASYEGRVEICVNEAWGTICSAGWSNTDANVVCKQLGYLPIGGRAITNGQYGPGVGPILMANIDCIGSEKTLLDCSHRSCEVTSCSHFNDAGVFCERNCTNGNIRLGDGAELRGRVEVCIMNVWSTICASHWTVIEATVICSQLGYSPYGAQAVTGVFIDYEWSIGIYELHCIGNESTIWDCIYQTSNTGQQCSQSTDASVFCMPNSTQYINCSDGDIRLIGGDVMNEGNVQICYNQVWGSVCDDYWGSDDSDVVCYQLGLQPFGSQAYGNNYFRVANNPWFVLGRFFCSGSEESLIECPRQSTSSLLQCESYEIAGVHCIGSCTHGSIRLRGSTNPYAGEVEVCIRGVWSNICGEEWDVIDATIVCRQLGLPTHGSLGLHGSLIPSIYPMRLYDTRCIGNEHSILLCSIQQTERGLSYEQCLSNKAIAFCQSPDTPYSDCMTGEVRLIGGINLLEGRVEICFNNIWGTICDHGWTFEDSNVVCHSLGHQAFGSVPMFSSIFGTSDLPIILTNLQCGGHENNLFQCQSNLANLLQCTHNKLAGVKCEALCTNGNIRIVGDTSNPPSYGRVDFCVNQTWGTICDSSWTESEASVVCRQKGFSPYGAIPVSNGPQNTLIPTNVDVVKCSGDENSLNDCTVTYGGQISMCVATADAGVICQNNDVHFSDCSTGDLRLVGPKPHEGRVEVCINKIWGAVCDDFWSITDANVACDQLGYYPSGAMPRYGSYYTGQGSLPSLISGLRCTGSESRLLDCTYDTSYAAVRHCGHFNQAGVKCHGSFPVYIDDNDKLPHGDIFGGELVCISGPFFNQDDDISCKFGEIYTTCQYISREKCVCIVPEQHFDGIIILEIIIRRPGEPVMYGATNYRYTVPNICQHINFDVGEIINLIHNVGEVTKFSWNPKDLDLSKSAVDDAVDITMQAYDLTRNVWENDIVLKEGVPNSGETDITIPDLVRAAKNGVSLIRINVKLKSLDFKRGSLLRTFKSSLKFAVKLKKSIYQRVACEAWHKSIPGVDANDLPPCPCNLEQMNGDLERYTKESALQFCFSKLFFKKPKAHSCYRQSNVGKFSSSQQCCYDEQSNLITGIGGGAPYSVYPNNWESFIGHVVSDIIPFYTVKTKS